MRARSKAICEVLLRNPKNGHLLYRPNKTGETPYNIDAAQQKSILQQIFGARKLNTHEDNENMLGYVAGGYPVYHPIYYCIRDPACFKRETWFK